MRGIFVPLQSWFPAITACSLDTSSARRLPPFSGHEAVELSARLWGRSLTCRPRPGHAPRRTGAAPQPTSPAGKDTPRFEHAPPPPVSLRPLPPFVGVGGPEGHAPRVHPSFSARPVPTPASPDRSPRSLKRTRPLDTPLHAPGSCKLPMHISDLRMPQNGPEPIRPSPLHTILAPPRPSRAGLSRGMAEDRSLEQLETKEKHLHFVACQALC